MPTCGIYIQVWPGEDEQGQIASMIGWCRELADELGWQVDEQRIVLDHVDPQTDNLWDSPNFIRLREAADLGHIQGIIVPTLDRLSQWTQEVTLAFEWAYVKKWALLSVRNELVFNTTQINRAREGTTEQVVDTPMSHASVTFSQDDAEEFIGAYAVEENVSIRHQMVAEILGRTPTDFEWTYFEDQRKELVQRRNGFTIGDVSRFTGLPKSHIDKLALNNRMPQPALIDRQGWRWWDKTEIESWWKRDEHAVRAFLAK